MTPEIDLDIQARIKAVDLLILDCDGVLTDGRIFPLPDGDELKGFDIKDGYGIRLAINAGLRVAFISGRNSKVVARRATELGIHHLYQGVGDKLEILNTILQAEGQSAERTAYMGDDWPDIPVLKTVGFAIAVADAAPEVKEIAHYVTNRPGGHGAVREVVELILRTRNLLPSPSA